MMKRKKKIVQKILRHVQCSRVDTSKNTSTVRGGNEPERWHRLSKGHGWWVDKSSWHKIRRVSRKLGKKNFCVKSVSDIVKQNLTHFFSSMEKNSKTWIAWGNTPMGGKKVSRIVITASNPRTDTNNPLDIRVDTSKPTKNTWNSVHVNLSCAGHVTGFKKTII